MKLVELPIESLKEAAWNPNQMDEAMTWKLGVSIERFGLVQNLVVRPVGDRVYEVLSGNQRLRLLREARIDTVPCVIVNVDDANARLLAQALNRVQGEDDLGLKAGLLREVLEALPEGDILAILPETADSLKALSSMGQETMADYLQNWQQAQAARLKHLQFQLTPAQLDVVESVLAQVSPLARQEKGGSPNVRGTALYVLCKYYLEAHRV